jgi:hypothetical protein
MSLAKQRMPVAGWKEWWSMDFRTIALLALWTLLSGPILALPTGGPNLSPPQVQAQETPPELGSSR